MKEQPDPLTGEEQELWRSFLSWSEQVVSLVSKDLAVAGISVPDYQVLVRVHEGVGHSLGQFELSNSLGWSPSRLSHQLSRMEKKGMLTRTEVGTGRLMQVTLTDHGKELIKNAISVHAKSVRRHFLDAVAEQRDCLTEIFNRRP
ncbi:MarR family winged helix-turn-helix transcriptional regulator [Streptomyces sp. NPDC056347]|uniref:MarR family winged helix-turn-helix transcriptional regulator n=1 Tax=Streptomyces sp. NPDC056347 TaxID=3345790 RepID=UPI0035D751CF